MNLDRLVVIDDKNYRQYVGDGQVVEQPDGTVRGTGWLGRQAPFAAIHRPIEETGIKLIPRSEWADRIKAGRAEKSFLSDIIKRKKIPCKDQNGLGYCWIYGSTSCVEAIRAINNLPTVELCPESCGGQITGWRNRGGYAEEAIDGLQKYGACDVAYVKDPHKLNPRLWKDGWKENALNYRATTEWYDIPTDSTGYDWLITLLLLRIPCAVGHNWWGHLIIHCDPWLFDDGSVGTLIRNSWGSGWGDDGFGVLSRSRCQPDGAFALRTVIPYEG